MPEFKYRAKNPRTKKIVTGTIKSQDVGHAKSMIRSMKLLPIGLKKSNNEDYSDDQAQGGSVKKLIYKDAEGKWQINISNDSPKTAEIIRFTGQLATLIKAGVPLLQSLEILSKQQKSKTFSEELLRIYNMVQRGKLMSEAFSAFPSRFDNLYISVVKASESSGNLDGGLKYIHSYMERNQKLASQLKSALTYPSFVLVLAIIMMWGMLTFVVPKMLENYEDDQELPAITQFVENVSIFLSNNLISTLVIIAIFIIAFLSWKKTPAGKMSLDTIILRIPLIGKTIQKINISRFCNIMATMLMSGVPLIDVIDSCVECTDNAFMKLLIQSTRAKVCQGDKLYEALESTGAMPDMVISMVSIGENTGELDAMLNKVAEYYDEEVQHSIGRILSLIEPVLIVGVGGFIALILASIYMPMFSMADNV